MIRAWWMQALRGAVTVGFAISIGLISSTASADLPQIDGSAFATRSISLADGVRGELVTFPSRTPTDYRPLIEGDLGSSTTLNAQLFLPQKTARKFPVIILVPGSGGIGPHHLEQAGALVEAGFAVLLIDPFHGRGIGDTIADQGRLSWAGGAYDVLAAVRWLRTRTDMDRKRIGAAGSSRGGTAVMMAASAPVARAVLGRGPGLRAIVAGYPWCGAQFRSAKLSAPTRLLVMQGDRDDWVSVQQCQDAVHAIIVAGGDARMKLFPGGLHALDRTGVPPTRIEDAVTSTIFPTIYMDDAGRYFDPRTGDVDARLTADDFSKHAIAGNFVHKGVTIGTSGSQAEDYRRELVRFLVETLSDSKN